MYKFIISLKRRVSLQNPLITWIRDGRRMRGFVQGSDIRAGATNVSALQIGVVVMPWCGSAVPWLSIAVGMLLGMRGHKIAYILDDLPFGPMDRMWRLQMFAIRMVLSVIEHRHSVIRMSTRDKAQSSGGLDNRTIDRLAQLNSVWALRGESPVTTKAVDEVRQQLIMSDAVIGELLRDERFDLLFVPGGIWGSSGLWLRHASSDGIRVSTYDSGGYGVLLLAVDGVACQLHDIPRAFDMLKKSTSPSESALVVSMANAEMDKRRTGTDKFSSQIAGSKSHNPAYAGGALIALNSSWDSAALGLHAAFDTTQEWLVETVRHLLDQTSVPVLVRQHPVERLPIARSNDDYGALLNHHFGENPRLHFISAHEPVNSYELMEQVCAVIVYTSTVGVEAAAQGKIVITESKSYYANLGFVQNAETPSDYFKLLDRAVAGELQISETMRDDAIAAYYITQCCNWVHTPLTVPDFPSWSQSRLNDLAEDPAVRKVVDAIEGNVPIAFLNHLENVAAFGALGSNA